MEKKSLTLKNFLEVHGNLVYLKKLDKEYIDEYWKSLDGCDVESNIFTGTQIMFNKTGIEKYLEEIASDNSRTDFIIFSKETDEMIGEVVVNDIYRNNRSANLRIAISKKENFNKGYGTEAIKLALFYAFGMLNLHRIELEAFSFNRRAIHVYEKIGFKREGIKRDGCFFNHKYYDMITMSILEDEFKAQYVNNVETLEKLIDG